MPCTLTDDEAERLENIISSKLSYYHHNPDGSDYSCVYCGEFAAPAKRGGEIKHLPDCEGQVALALLSRRTQDLESKYRHLLGDARRELDLELSGSASRGRRVRYRIGIYAEIVEDLAQAYHGDKSCASPTPKTRT